MVDSLYPVRLSRPWGLKMHVSGLEKRLANLRPYRRGENGHTRKAAERARLESEIIAELGADLTASDRLELRHAVELLTRRPRDHVDAVRCSNAGSRIIAKVRARYGASPVLP